MADETTTAPADQQPATTDSQAQPTTSADSQPAPQPAADSTSPDSTPTNKPAPAKKPSAREAELQSQLDAALTDMSAAITARDGYQSDLAATQRTITQLTADRDAFEAAAAESAAQVSQLQTEVAQLQAEAVAVASAAPAPEAEPTEADKTADLKALLVRNGLKKAYRMPDGTLCFDETYARHFVGEGFDALEVITAE